MPTPYEKAVFHTGFPKTGTKTVQRVFSANRSLLAEHGVYYPEGDYNHGFLHRHFAGADRADRDLARPRRRGHLMAIDRNRMDHLEREMRASTGHAILLSSEFFGNLTEAGVRRMKEWGERHAITVETLTYVRHPLSFATSFTQQRVKMGAATLEDMTASQFQRTIRSRLSALLAVLGHDSMVVRPYDRKSLVGGSTLTDLCDVVGVDAPLVIENQTTLNKSMSAVATIIKSRMNAYSAMQGRPVTGKRWLFKLEGPKFALPADRIAMLLEGSRSEVAWLREHFGIELPPPDATPALPTRDYFTDDVVRTLRRLQRRRPFRTTEEGNLFDKVCEDLQQEGLVPPKLHANGKRPDVHADTSVQVH